MTARTTFRYEGPSEYDPGLNLTVTDLEQILLTLKRAQEAKIRFTGDLVSTTRMQISASREAIRSPTASLNSVSPRFDVKIEGRMSSYLDGES